LLTPAKAMSLPRTMQSLGRRYVRYINWAHQRTGTLWEGRYRAAPVDSEDYFLSCCRYIELNPVRAGLARSPRDYPHSSYRAHAYGEEDALARDHETYRALARSAGERQRVYRDLFRDDLPAELIDELRAATNGGWAIGNDRFKKKIAKALARRVTPLPRGPKPKEQVDKRQPNLL
jgi:putative transposase